MWLVTRAEVGFPLFVCDREKLTDHNLNAVYPQILLYDILLGGNALFMHVCINVERWHFILQYIWGCCHADISSFIVCGM